MSTIEFDLSELTRYLSDIEKHVIFQATQHSLNKGMDRIATRAIKGGSQELRVGQKVLRTRMKKHPADLSHRHLQSSVVFDGRGIPLIKLNARQTKTGVTVRAKIRGRKANVNRLQGAFIARMPSGRIGVYKRAGAKRLPINEQFLSLKPMQKILNRIGQRVVEHDFPTLFEHEARRIDKQIQSKLRKVNRARRKGLI